MGNGTCARCHKEEDDVHIFLLCTTIEPLIRRLSEYVASWGKTSLSWKHLLIGDSIGCSSELSTIFRIEILWFFWIERLTTVYNGSTRNTGTLKSYLITAGERFCSRKISVIEAKISKIKDIIARNPKNERDKFKFHQIQEKRDVLVQVDLGYILKLQYL